MMLLMTKAMIFLHMFVGVILIGVILLQRGRGGGLAGAFGGMGGQSAFGTKAGDVFTRITIVLATIWIVLGGLCILAASNSTTKASRYAGGSAADVKKAPAVDGDTKSTNKTDAANSGSTKSEGTKPEGTKPGAGVGENKPGHENDGEKKSGDAIEGGKSVTPQPKDGASGETPDKSGDAKTGENEKPTDEKPADNKDADSSASSSSSPKPSEGKEESGASSPDKPVENKPE
jgi:preprotein translocase subunit SecG